MAQLLLANGKSDEAAQLLIPVLRAYYHVHQAGTNLVTQMIAVVCLKGTYNQLDSILEKNKVSQATKAEIASILREAPPVAVGIGNAFTGERYFFRTEMDRLRTDVTEVLKSLKQTGQSDTSLQAIPFVDYRLVLSFLFNPNRAEKEYDDFLTETCLLGQNRRLDSSDIAEKAFEEKLSLRRLKNPVGRSLSSMAAPAFDKVLENFWKVEDQRVTLLQRLSVKT
jgi:hypothetical protein